MILTWTTVEAEVDYTCPWEQIPARTMNHWNPHKGWTAIQGLLALHAGNWLRTPPWWHFPVSFKKQGWPLIVLCIVVRVKIISYRQAPHPTCIKQAPVVPVHFCCRAAEGVREPNTSEGCSSIQITCMCLAACRLDCRVVGAALEENNSF